MTLRPVTSCASRRTEPTEWAHGEAGEGRGEARADGARAAGADADASRPATPVRLRARARRARLHRGPRPAGTRRRARGAREGRSGPLDRGGLRGRAPDGVVDPGHANERAPAE